MLLFRMICAGLVGVALLWAMSRSEAAALEPLQGEFIVVAPLAGALVGYFNLAARQGWGAVVALANGIWAGFLSLVMSASMVILVQAMQVLQLGPATVERVFGSLALSTAVVIDKLVTLPLMMLVIGATCGVGLLTELIHWMLVRLRGAATAEDESGPATPG